MAVPINACPQGTLFHTFCGVYINFSQFSLCGLPHDKMYLFENLFLMNTIKFHGMNLQSDESRHSACAKQVELRELLYFMPDCDWVIILSQI